MKLPEKGAESLERDLVISAAEVPESVCKGTTSESPWISKGTLGRNTEEETSTSFIWVLAETKALGGFGCFLLIRGQSLYR